MYAILESTPIGVTGVRDARHGVDIRRLDQRLGRTSPARRIEQWEGATTVLSCRSMTEGTHLRRSSSCLQLRTPDLLPQSHMLLAGEEAD